MFSEGELDEMIGTLAAAGRFAFDTETTSLEAVRADLVGLSFAVRPGGAPEALIAYLAQHETRKRILVIGHEPDLSELAGRLIGAGHRAHLALKKGGCCLVEFSEFPPKSPGKLIWWLTPRVTRRVR